MEASERRREDTPQDAIGCADPAIPLDIVIPRLTQSDAAQRGHIIWNLR
jgi:hypothetical protein